MVRKLVLASVLFITFSAIIQAQNSYIQVVADPGISVFLDGQFKGITNSDFGGLIIEKLSAGTYAIKVVKEGFSPQEDKISVKSGEVFLYTIKPFKPRVIIKQQGNEDQKDIGYSTGKLKIQSLPIRVRIELPSIDINSLKTQDEWYAEELPIGNYPVRFSWSNLALEGTIIIVENKQTEIFVSFVDRTIDFRGETANEHKKLPIEWVFDESRLGNQGVHTGSVDSRVRGIGTGQGPDGFSWSLAGRSAQSLPVPKYDYLGEGIVVVEITVNRTGRVTSATPGVKGSTTLDEYLLKVARDAALLAKFDNKADAPMAQKGTITYVFTLR